MTSIPISIRSLALSLLLISANSSAQTELLPNIVALPPSDISIVKDFSGAPELRFAVQTWNNGEGALEVVAGGVNQQGRQNVFQRVYATDGGYTDYLAGKFEWHSNHDHFHFEDYSIYTLQAVSGNSKRSSSKTTFCLMDTDQVDKQLPGSPQTAVYDQCGNAFQGMSVGWGDEYGADLPGQEIDLTRFPDGQYRLTVDADPKRRLRESNEDDNSACVLLDISVTNETVTVLNGQSCESSGGGGGGEVVVTGITPNLASASGASVDVTITGSGFADGMNVSFENGTGSQPMATDVVVALSGETITAKVSIKKKGRPDPDNVWDLRVGSGVLVDAFTVVP